MVLISIGFWKGVAILDTGSSYTLLNERVWSEINGTMKPWEKGPLYLTYGKSQQPLRWSEVTITLQSQTKTVPCVIMPEQSLFSLLY